MGERDARRDAGHEEWFTRAPRVSDALKRGVLVSVLTWGGRRVSGRVCDREPYGLLLDVEGPDGDPADVESGGSTSYVFMPWTSVDQVWIQDIITRRVKYLRDG